MEGDLKLTVNPTPSQELIQRAANEVSVTDSAGRVIKLKKPGVLAQFRLIEALGETAKNGVYTGMVLPLIYVASIDGIPIFQPTSKLQIEALIQQLDEHGIEATMAGVEKHFGGSNPEADKDALKKS